MIPNNFPALGAVLADLWCMDRTRLNRLVADLSRTNEQRLGGAVGGFASPQSDFASETVGGTAKIPIHGVIMKRVPAVFAFLGIEATSTEQTGQAIQAALADPAVERIELAIDSPGGTISGVQQLADLIYESRSKKPITAKVSDLAASAAYWLASQAETIEANPGALVGSIGVYRVMVDSSQAAENNGVKVHLIASGQNKGAGTPGAPISAGQLEDEQRIVDGAAAMFTAAIARGRGMQLTGIEELATGSTWFAEEAQRLGLVDNLTAATMPQDETPDPVNSEEGEPVEQTPPGAAVGSTPEPEAAKLQLEVAQLHEQLNAARAEASANSAALVAVVETQKLEIITEGIKAGRIVPAMLEQVENFAQFCGDDLEKLRGFVASLPVQTRATTESQDPGLVVRDTLSDSDRAVAKAFGLDPLDMHKKSEWSAISAAGDLLDVNGQKIGGLN